MYGGDVPWLWRGQPNATYGIEPSIHTRITRQEGKLDDGLATRYTGDLIKAARAACLDRHEATILPDMALLALLQHHGAATPLLDVSLDPVVALYMAVVSPSKDDFKEDGVLFAIRRPSTVIDAFDSRGFEAIYDQVPVDAVCLYSAPDVSERLRIQRGHFLVGRHDRKDPRITIPLTLDSRKRIQTSWIWRRMLARGNRGPIVPASTDVAVFRITAKFKSQIQTWLEARSGLTTDFVYPTSWHQPHLDRFAYSHRRTAEF